MPDVISVHKYKLKEDVPLEAFLQVIAQAEDKNLFQIPGLMGYHFLMGIKGERIGCPAAIWVYESRETWESLWGTVERPNQPQAYPEKWQQWEALLEPLLMDHPDEISFTSYEVLTSG